MSDDARAPFVGEVVVGTFDAEECWQRFKMTVSIRWDGERLSIMGESKYGDRGYSGGQNTDDLLKIAEQKGCPHRRMLYDIWKRWHLNDMRAGCEHQRELGWGSSDHDKVTIYRYTLNGNVLGERSAVERKALHRLKEGDSVHLPDDVRALLNLPYEVKTYTPLDDERYKLASQESKELGWLTPEEHPDGLLCRPCPVCGYKYGTQWLKEDVPTCVLDQLREIIRLLSEGII